MAVLIHDIDLNYLDTPGAASAFLLMGDAPLLVECGPAACFDTLCAGIRAHGVDPTRISDVVVTHIHLDHAGAAGHFARHGARIHVHPLGVKHLVDPAKLVESSRRVHGERYDRWYGDLLPVPQAQIREWQDGETGTLAGAPFRAHFTPGHARHHIAWELPTELFAGDVGAMVIPGTQCISVPTPPPEFDTPAWGQSLTRLRALPPRRVWCTHGGAQPDGADYLRRAAFRVEEECRALASALAAGDGAAADSHYKSHLDRIEHIDRVSPDQRAHFLGHAFRQMNLQGAERALGKGLLAHTAQTAALTAAPTPPSPTR
ncbi:MAG: MBL fold metallo-hydrolase [Planctomycetota bacterium]|nr:MBL fold metallo-hydrolase [Planctomycetota bacterium]MDA1106103.1 MBL fold metallo-hydrolase [Planctomycetota bacterium]